MVLVMMYHSYSRIKYRFSPCAREYSYNYVYKDSEVKDLEICDYGRLEITFLYVICIITCILHVHACT